jgi:patatin-like phospholipase/acyl hydrolase
VLAGLEERFLGGASVAGYFDLIVGTSTGGILALGLGAGLRATELRNLYVDHGCEIFPPLGPGVIRPGPASLSREATIRPLHL